MARPFKPRVHPSSYASDESGVAAVEFAIILPILVVMLTGIIQLGGILFIQNQMGDVARQTARNLAVGELTGSQAQQFATDNLITWGGSYTITITEPDPNDPADNDFVVDIQIPMASVSLVDFTGAFASGNLRATSTMRQE